jgi:tetratricopeptide (TPR) repeat protein
MLGSIRKLLRNLFSPSEYLKLGAEYARQGKYDCSIEAYNEWLQLRPNHAGGYTSRGSSYEEKKDYDNAFSDYNQAIAIEPLNIHALWNRGNLHLKVGDPASAITDFTTAIGTVRPLSSDSQRTLLMLKRAKDTISRGAAPEALDSIENARLILRRMIDEEIWRRAPRG